MELKELEGFKIVTNKRYNNTSKHNICVQYEDRFWLLKRGQSYREYFKKDEEVKNQIIGKDSPISEYIGSHIYKFAGIPVHETQLCTINGGTCVLCEDTAYPNNVIKFSKIGMNEDNTDYKNYRYVNSVNLNDILERLDKMENTDKEELMQRFWDMFVIDTLIDNVDRHNDNWGFVKLGTGEYILYPAYDNGFCLNSYLTDEDIQKVYEEEQGIIRESINVHSVYELDGKKIFALGYLKDNIYNKYIQNAIRKASSIEYDDIKNLLKSMIPVISDLRAKFYYETMCYRLRELKKLSDKI